jgi:hypothetical protein
MQFFLLPGSPLIINALLGSLRLDVLDNRRGSHEQVDCIDEDRCKNEVQGQAKDRDIDYRTADAVIETQEDNPSPYFASRAHSEGNR